MIPPKVWAYLGVGIGVLGLMGLVFWQANSLMKKGVALGKAESTIERLRETIKIQRDADRTEWDKLREDLVVCNERVDAAEAAGNAWKEEADRIKLRPPRIVTVEIESETWHDSLVEGHGKLLAGLERLRDEDTPFPPG